MKSMGMQLGVSGSLTGGHEKVGVMLVGLSISYLFLQGPRWTDGGKW